MLTRVASPINIWTSSFPSSSYVVGSCWFRPGCPKCCLSLSVALSVGTASFFLENFGAPPCLFFWTFRSFVTHADHCIFCSCRVLALAMSNFLAPVTLFYWRPRALHLVSSPSSIRLSAVGKSCFVLLLHDHHTHRDLLGISFVPPPILVFSCHDVILHELILYIHIFNFHSCSFFSPSSACVWYPILFYTKFFKSPCPSESRCRPLC